MVVHAGRCLLALGSASCCSSACRPCTRTSLLSLPIHIDPPSFLLFPFSSATLSLLFPLRIILSNLIRFRLPSQPDVCQPYLNRRCTATTGRAMMNYPSKRAISSSSPQKKMKDGGKASSTAKRAGFPATLLRSCRTFVWNGTHRKKIHTIHTHRQIPSCVHA